MTSHCWNLSRFLSLTCVFLGALGREVDEFHWDIGSLHQYTQEIVLKILRCGAIHMNSYSWNLSRFISLTCIFLGALGREDQSP